MTADRKALAGPERIWAWSWLTQPMGQWGVQPSQGTVEYIRADLATPAPVVPAEGMREVETKLKAMIAGFRHGLDPEGCSYDAGIRDVLDKLAAILAAAEKEKGNG